jgi:hypothetical protein
MPLTRNAARRLAQAQPSAPPTDPDPDPDPDTSACATPTKPSKSKCAAPTRPSPRLKAVVEKFDLSLREDVKSKSDAVWRARGDVDLYTLHRRPVVATLEPQVDHTLEVQLCEFALAGRAPGPQEGACLEWMRTHMNAVPNLNVTTRRCNQSKRGPVTAALNRLGAPGGAQLREVNFEQLARQGRARWMVDEGVWARVEAAMRASHSELEAAVGEGPNTRASRLREDVVGDLGDLLSKLGVK